MSPYFVLAALFVLTALGGFGVVLYYRFMRYPIEVIVYERIGDKIFPYFDRAKNITQRTEEGTVTVLKFKKTGDITEQPSYHSYVKVGQREVLQFYKPERGVYLPLLNDNQTLMVEEEVPIYETDEEGNVVYDENGNPKIREVRKTYAKLFDGNFYVKLKSIDENKMLVDRIEPIPVVLPELNKSIYDFIADMAEIKRKLLSAESWFEKYLTPITLITVVIVVVIVVYASARYIYQPSMQQAAEMLKNAAQAAKAAKPPAAPM